MTGLLDVFEERFPGLLGKLGQTWPARMGQGLLDAASLPGDVYAGRVQMVDPATGRTSQQAINRSADLGGMVMGGAYGVAPSGALGMAGGKMKYLPSSASLNTPPAPTAADMMRASRVERVPVSQARGTQSKMDWDKFDSGSHPPPLIEGYADLPVAVRKLDGEYLIFDGHHRTAKALNDGVADMPMHVIDARDYAPQFAGRKPAPVDNSDVDEIFKALFGGSD